MKIKWFGHSAFAITSQSGRVLITDPYEAGGYNGAIGYLPINMVADIVGMTAVPEVVLAREKGMCFTSICLVCNMAAGLQKQLPADEIASLYKKKEPLISQILKFTIQSLDEKQPCQCPGDVSKATL
jgi:5'-methylthioadenosine phosphorylase